MKTQPTFAPAFFAPFSDAVSPPVTPKPVQKPVLFSDEKYHGSSMQQFMDSPDFARCQQEFVALLDRVVDFAEKNADKIVPSLSADAVATIRQHVTLLKSHLTDLANDFFSNHKPIVYGPGKEMFHELDALLHNPKISFQKRLDAIQAMAPQVGMCSGGMLTVVGEALSSLKHSTAGLKGAAYRTKLQMIDALISQHVSATHDYAPGNEVHFVNAYFNYIANDMGVPARRDAFASIAESAISTEQLSACKQKILSRLTPTRLTGAMAEDYLGRIKSAVADAEIDVSKPVADDQLTALFNATHNIRKANLDQEFGPVPETDYLLPVADTYHYQLAKQPTLVARHFIEHLKEAALIDDAAPIRIATGNPDTGDLMLLGDLFWREKDGSCEEINAQELMQMSPHQVVQALNEAHIPGPSQDAILQRFARHLPDTIYGDIVQPVRNAWLDTFAGIFGKSGSADQHWILPVVFLAAAWNRATTLHALIEAGAELNAYNEQDMTATMVAASLGQAEALAALAAGGANLNAADSDGGTAAMFAADDGHCKALEALVTGGADLEARDKLGRTAVMFAADKGHADVMQALIAGGANLDATDSDGVSAAMIAANNGHTDALQALIDGGADLQATNMLGRTAMMFAVLRGHAEALRILIAGGANFNAVGPDGMGLVTIAVVHGNAGAVQALIAGGANCDATNSDGVTAAMYAAGKGRSEALQVLIAAGANVNAADSRDRTALMFAAISGHADALRLLIASGASLDVADRSGRTATMCAAIRGEIGALRTLIAGGANCNATTPNGKTAVLFAAERGHREALVVLIAGGADPDARNSRGRTAMMIAVITANDGVLDTLIAGGADLDATNSSGRTAAMIAAINGNTRALQALFAAGANPDARDSSGATAMTYAAHNGHADAVDVLIAAGAAVEPTHRPDNRAP